MEGQISEIPTKNPIVKAINKTFGLTLESKFLVPDNLNHEIKQPLERSIYLKGPKKNLQVLCTMPNSTISFNEVSPQGTVFEMHESKKKGFEADDVRNKVLVPSNLGLLKDDFAYGITHEISHLWENQDKEWIAAQNKAKDILCKKPLNNFPEENLSKNSDERQEEINAWKIIGDNEKRAAEIAIYIVGRLKSLGVDILPQYSDAQSLLGLVNPSLHSHQKFNQKLTLSLDEINNLMRGNLPYPVLKEKINAKLSKLSS